MGDTEEIKALLKEIRDGQREHYQEWKRAYAESQQLREQAEVRFKQARRSQVIWWVILAVVAASIVLPIIQWAISWATHDLRR